MAINNNGLYVAKFGGLFTAAENVSPLSVINDFTIGSGPSGSVWYDWGHLSRENLPETESDGGDTTSLSTWRQANTGSESEPVTETTTYGFVQLDAATIAKAVELNGQKVSALEVWFSGVRRFGIWRPSCKVALTGRPGASTENYSEMKMALTILSPNPTIADLVDVEAGIVGWPSTGAPDTLYIDNSAFVPPAGP